MDQFQTSTISKNGEKIYLEITASRLWDGKIQTGALAVSRVINERKKAEEQKQLLLNDLEEINSELTNFAYIVSHDLKAPLRAIDSLAHWILEDYAKSFDKEGKEQMSLLIKRVDRMHNLIEGILEYSRVGRVKENMIEINLNILLSEVIEMIAPPDNFQITIEDEFPTIVAEEVRIKQVFQNLLSNAVKFNDKKEGVINLNCRYDTDRWIFEVSDNGPGIEKKYFEKIFGIFQTLVSRDTFESTGIGLSLIKKIVSVYGGEVWVESVLGEGSSFYFTIPKKIGEQQ
jgi:light-regulated signal transduction histidine kinase (bacteriophytochrome)